MRSMKKTMNRVFAITTAIAIINFVASIFFILRLPESVPVHFNFNFVCDRVGSRWNGIVPSAILLLLVPIYYFSEKGGKNYDQNSKPMSIVLIITDFFIVAVNWLLLALMDSGANIGERMTIGFDWIMMLLLSFLFITLGNYMPTFRQNKTLGIKLPWTLKNEKCWNLTHRFSGKVYVAAGFVTLAVTMAMKIFNIKMVWAFALYVCIILPCVIILPTAFAYKHRND